MVTATLKIPWYVAALVCCGAVLASAGSALRFEHFALEDPAVHDADFAVLATGDLQPLIPRSLGDLPRVARLAVYWPDAALGAEPQSGHALSLATAVAMGLLLWLLLTRTCGAGWASLAGTVLVLLHPVTAEHAAWVARRPDLVALMSALGCLASLSRCWQQARGHWLAAMLLGAVAMLLQPLALALPFMAAALAWLLGARGRCMQEAKRLAPLLVLGCIALAIVLLPAPDPGGEQGVRGSGLSAPAVAETAAAVRHLRELVVPWPLVLHGTIPADAGWLNAALLLAAVAALLLLCRRAPALAAASTVLMVALLPILFLSDAHLRGFASRDGLFLLPGLALLAGLCAVGRSARVIALGAFPLALVSGVLASSHAASFADAQSALRDGAAHEAEDAWYPLTRAELPALPGASVVDAAREADLRHALKLAESGNTPVQALRAEALLAELLLRSGRAREAAPHLAHALGSVSEASPVWHAAGLSVQSLRRREVEVLLSAGEDAAAEAAAMQLIREQAAAADCLLAGRIQLRSALRELAAGAGGAAKSEACARVEAALELLARASASEAADVSAPALLARGSGLIAAEWIAQHLTQAQEMQLTLARRFPGRAEPLLLSSDLRALGGDRQGSLRDLLQALERNVRDLQLFARAARELMAVGENRRAVAILRLGLRVDSRAEDLRTLLAELLLAQGRQSQGAGDHARALRAAEEALQLLPDVAEGEALRGDALMSLGRWETAEAALKRALELGPGLADARRGMARFLQARGLGALADLKATLAATPEAERPAREQSLRDQVLADFRRALELGGDWVELALARRHVLGTEQAAKRAAAEELIRRGRAELKSGNAIAARELARQAVRVHGALPEASLFLARTELRCNDPDAALVALETVLQLDPDDLEALLLAAQLKHDGGKEKDARRLAQRFLDLTKGELAVEFKEERDLLKLLIDGVH